MKCETDRSIQTVIDDVIADTSKDDDAAVAVIRAGRKDILTCTQADRAIWMFNNIYALSATSFLYF